MLQPSAPLSSSQTDFLRPQINKMLLGTTLFVALAYFLVLTFWFPKGSLALFVILVAGEVFHLWQAFGYIHTIWQTEYFPKSNPKFYLSVDVYITVAGEPVEIVEATARAAMQMDYPDFQVYLLNDGKVAKKDNWQEIEALAASLGANCITRQIPGGAKAGNINNALKITKAPLVAVFDADQVPHPDFLNKTVGYFADPKMGFVQSPQYYKNYEKNEVTRGAWEQQELFFGPISKGKNRLNAVFMCGTNMVIRKNALLDAGGMYEKNIAEDFLTSLFVHQKGWKSIYVPEILAEGLAPEDFISYYKQQFRWARGSLEIIFKHNPLFKRRLTFSQRIQYLSSASYYLSGIVVVLNAILPLIFFYTGLVPLTISTMGLAAIFLPYIFLTIIVLRLSSNSTYTFKALAFSMSSFAIQLKAVWAVLTNQKTGFSVTAKKQLQGSFLSLVIPHISYILLVAAGVEVAILREGLNAEVFTNLAWALFNVSAFLPFIIAALPEKTTKRFSDRPSRKPVLIERPDGSKPPRVPRPNLSLVSKEYPAGSMSKVNKIKL